MERKDASESQSRGHRELPVPTRSTESVVAAAFTVCPTCGSDNYVVMYKDAKGEPDFAREKWCRNCLEEWF